MCFWWLFQFFKKIRFWVILGPPYCGIGATIRIGQEMLCLPFLSPGIFYLAGIFEVCSKQIQKSLTIAWIRWKSVTNWWNTNIVPYLGHYQFLPYDLEYGSPSQHPTIMMILQATGLTMTMASMLDWFRNKINIWLKELLFM